MVMVILSSRQRIRVLHHHYLGGKIRLGTKAHLLHCLELEEIQETNPCSQCQVLWWCCCCPDASSWKIFQDYADAVFTPYIYIYSHLESIEQVDIVWDMYVAGSLQSTTGRREARVSEEELLQPQQSHRTGWTSYMCMKTNQSCQVFVPACHKPPN